MDLITKNKIAAYIEQHHEAQAIFLSWIKDLRYSAGEKFNINFEQGNDNAAGVWACSIGLGDYHAVLCINPWLNTAYIIWLGSEDEHRIYRQQEAEELRAKYPNEVFEQVVVTSHVTIKAPDIVKRLKKTVQNKSEEPAPLTAVEVDEADSLTRNKVFDEKVIATQSEYEGATKRAIELFYSKPQTAEFAELALLLRRIKNYEHENIKLPQLTPLDAIRVKMNVLSLTPQNLTHLFQSAEEADLFFSGKQPGSEFLLAKLYKLLCIKFPVRDSK